MPWSARACSQENRAVRAPPTCKKPVGLGAKRVLVVILCLLVQVTVYFDTDGEFVKDKVMLSILRAFLTNLSIGQLQPAPHK